MRLLRNFLVAASALAAVALPAAAGESETDRAPSAPAAQTSGARWDPEVVDLFARLPVQDGGRVKPFSTYAGFALLAISGGRSAKDEAGAKLGATEWLMDCLFHPETAAKHRVFLVENADALDLVGLAHEGHARRDRYAYDDLRPARRRIYEEATQIAQLPERERGVAQGQLLRLAESLHLFERLASLLPASALPDASVSPCVASLATQKAPRLGDLLANAATVAPWIAGGHSHGDPHGAGGSAKDPALAAWVESAVHDADALALFPPAEGGATAQWLTPGDVIEASLLHGQAMPSQVEALRRLDAMAAARGDAARFAELAREYSDGVVQATSARGEYGRVPLEVTYYRLGLFHWAFGLFLIAFAVVALSWVKQSKWLTRGALWTTVLALACLATGITMRCLIRGRPPVTTLYESILFTTAIAVGASLVAERFHRRGIGLSLAPVLGAAGTLLANTYEVQERVDTMPSLVAVLDTNFWLAAHVTTIAIGYGAGLLAGAVGHVHVLARVFRIKRNDAGFFKTLETMTYGTLCFSLLFSVVGTVLGGIWANESWGRFWGWDPKENGALAICLWQVLVLHARLSGMIRGFGVAQASIVGAVVVASSWWGVNLLGVGLHSYGFTSGILVALLSYYGVEVLVLAAGGVHWLLDAGRAPAAPPSA